MDNFTASHHTQALNHSSEEDIIEQHNWHPDGDLSVFLRFFKPQCNFAII